MVEPWLGGGALSDQLRSEEWARPALGARVDRFDSSMVERFGPRPAATKGAPCEPCLNLRFATDHGPMSFVTFESIFALSQDVTLASLRVELWFPADGRTRELMHKRPEVGRSAGAGCSGSPSRAGDEEKPGGQKQQRNA